MIVACNTRFSGSQVRLLEMQRNRTVLEPQAGPTVISPASVHSTCKLRTCWYSENAHPILLVIQIIILMLVLIHRDILSIVISFMFTITIANIVHRYCSLQSCLESDFAVFGVGREVWTREEIGMGCWLGGKKYLRSCISFVA